MKVKTNKIEVVDSMTVTFSRSEIFDLVYCVHEFNDNRLRMLVSQMLEKANLTESDDVKKELYDRAKADTSMWYVEIRTHGNVHVFADAVGTIIAMCPNQSGSLAASDQCVTNNIACLGKWIESDARTILKCLSDAGFEASMRKCSEEC